MRRTDANQKVKVTKYWKTLIINGFRFTSEAQLFNNKQSIICVGTHGLDSAASNRKRILISEVTYTVICSKERMF